MIIAWRQIHPLCKSNFQLKVLFFREGRQAVTSRKVNKAITTDLSRFIYLCISFEDYYRTQRETLFSEKEGPKSYLAVIQ